METSLLDGVRKLSSISKSIASQFFGLVVGLLLIVGAVSASAQTTKGGKSAADRNTFTPLDQLIRQIEQEFLPKDDTSTALLDQKALNCDTLPEDVSVHFQQLEQRYFEIRQTIEQSNKQRVKILKDWRSSGFQCSAKFQKDNQSEIDNLKKLQIGNNLEELKKISLCVGPKIEKLELSMRTASVPSHIEKMTKDMDKLRRLTSSTTNMTMDLAYFKDKLSRLVEEYAANLKNCS